MPARYRYACHPYPYLAAGLRGDRGALCALRRLGVAWGRWGMLRAAVEEGNRNGNGQGAVVQWMVAEGGGGGSGGEARRWA